MAEIYDMVCCGLKELTQLSFDSSPLHTVRSVAYDAYNHGHVCGGYIFTQAGSTSKYGDRLAKYIVDNKYGKVSVMPPFINPNTSRKIKTFLWIPNRRKLMALGSKTEDPYYQR